MVHQTTTDVRRPKPRNSTAAFTASSPFFAMPRIAIAMPHVLGQETAVARVKQLLEKVKHKYQDQVSDLAETWNDNVMDFQFKTYTFNIKGQLKVEPNQVALDGDIPFAALMFKGRIEQTLKDELTRLLA